MDALLPDAALFGTPFPHLRVAEALPRLWLAELRALFEAPLPWRLHDDAFYRAWLCDHPFDAERAARLARRTGELLGLPLTPEVRLTVQRMDPGQYALPHTDRPLLGYESARLVVQLSEGWRPGDGGVFRMGASQQIPPRFNSGVAFVLRPDSEHEVTTTTRTRWTAVFNFFHPANPPWLAERLKGEVEGLAFSALPDAVQRALGIAEAERPEEDSLRAGRVAWLLHRRGYSGDLVAAFEAALEPLARAWGPMEVLQARWDERLLADGFDDRLWAGLGLRCPVFETGEVQRGR